MIGDDDKSAELHTGILITGGTFINQIAAWPFRIFNASVSIDGSTKVQPPNAGTGIEVRGDYAEVIMNGGEIINGMGNLSLYGKNAKLTINNGTFSGSGRAVDVDGDEAELIINDVDMAGMIMITPASGDNARVTINGGSFEASKPIKAYFGITLINGGTFLGNEKIEILDDSEINITGGTFGFDPSDYVDDISHKVIDNNDGTFTVELL